jgi:hypothetical protein
MNARSNRDVKGKDKYKDKGGKAVWPSVEEQLAASQVIPGSALEKLIKENQDFAMLDPAEGGDRWKLPPWLRVYWRKQHPEIKYRGPGVGYPLALKEIHAWMMRNQDLPGKRA